MPTTPIQIAMLASGILLMTAAFWLLFHSRRTRREQERLRLPEERREPTPAKALAEPTRMSIALSVLILGYHLIAWAFPPHVLAVQLARQWWWVWFLAGATVVAMSVVMDRIDREPRGGDGAKSGG